MYEFRYFQHIVANSIVEGKWYRTCPCYDHRLKVVNLFPHADTLLLLRNIYASLN